MTTSPLSPALARAAEHLHAGERDAAGRLLKAYLADHPRDADAWWLMSQAVSRPQNVRSCLERVLKLRPDDVQAKARLAQLSAPEPEDSYFAIRPSPRAASSSQPAPFDPTADLGEPFDPFTGIDTPDDPFAALRGQQPGTGLQPDWGPGLEFVRERPAAPKKAAPRRSGLSRKMTGLLAGIFAVIVLVGALVVVARDRGWINLGGLPEMRVLDGGSFSLEYPADWGAECKTGMQGALVCGIANDPRYNEVDLYGGSQADFAGMFSSAVGDMLSLGNPPDLALSVIAMDLSPDSPYYRQGSQAKLLHDVLTEYGTLGGDYASEYDEREQTINGHSARVFRLDVKDTSGTLEAFVTGGDGDWSLYDVYIPHDDRVFWMTVQAMALHNREKIPHDVIAHMIESIDLKEG